MRKLDRGSVPPPTCLAQYKHGRDNWGTVTSEHKAQIRASLETMQGVYCAYCEASLSFGDHIEHLYPKGRFPLKTFLWENLYWSCNQNDCCGHYKDTRGKPYHPVDLLAPCEDEPGCFLKFRTDGQIEAAEGLAPHLLRRGQETLRVFHLNNARLVQMRRTLAQGYIYLVNELEDARLELDEDDFRQLVEDEINQVTNAPFSSLIRQMFEALL